MELAERGNKNRRYNPQIANTIKIPANKTASFANHSPLIVVQIN